MQRRVALMCLLCFCLDRVKSLAEAPVTSLLPCFFQQNCSWFQLVQLRLDCFKKVANSISYKHCIHLWWKQKHTIYRCYSFAPCWQKVSLLKSSLCCNKAGEQRNRYFPAYKTCIIPCEQLTFGEHRKNCGAGNVCLACAVTSFTAGLPSTGFSCN